MAWEDEELEAYENNKKKAAAANTLAQQRNTLLSQNRSTKWTELRAEFNKIVKAINEKAERVVISSTSPIHDEIRLVREDGVKLDGDWTINTCKAKFHCDQYLEADRAYKLTVRIINGNDAVVWIPLRGSNQPETSESIAKLLLSNFIRAEMSA
jgi:hypothetical protein